MSVTIGQVREVVVEALETVVLPRFDALESRMDGFEHRMDRLEYRMDRLEQRIGGLEGRVTSIESQLRDMRAKLGEMDGRLTALEADVKELYGMVAQVQKAQAGDRKFAALSTDAKIRRLQSQVIALAEAEGVKLPRAKAG
jgi:chromosome segregation ATPase